MEQYADRPMDLDHATLVALAKEHGDRRIFTLDTDFQIYRLRSRQRFETIPTLWSRKAVPIAPEGLLAGGPWVTQ